MAERRIEYFWLTCDLCGTPSSRSESMDTVERFCERRGWLIQKIDYYGAYGHLCSVCREKPRPDWWPKEEVE